MHRVPLLLTPKQVYALPKATTKILDASWHMPNSPRNASQEYLTGPRIPHSLRWDVDRISTPKTEPSSSTSSSAKFQNPLGLGHMMPSPETFAKACRERGITKSDHVVVYDTVGIFSAPRAAFTFASMGHEKVSVLDGGLPRWMHEGYEVEHNAVESELASRVEKSDYPVPTFQDDRIKSYEQVVENSKLDKDDASAELVLDARSRDRWTGAAPEPRAGLSSGHIPHSLSLAFNTLLNPSTPDRSYTSYLPTEQLRSIILKSIQYPGETDKDAQIRWESIKRGKKGVTWTCGSGMTACVGVWGMRVLAAAEERDEGMKVGIYDESWTGYAMRKESEIVKGEE